MPVPRKKKALPKGYNPITRQPYEKKSGLGYVASGSVTLDNVTTMGKEQRERRSGRGGERQQPWARRGRIFRWTQRPELVLGQRLLLIIFLDLCIDGVHGRALSFAAGCGGSAGSDLAASCRSLALARLMELRMVPRGRLMRSEISRAVWPSTQWR